MDGLIGWGLSLLGAGAAAALGQISQRRQRASLHAQTLAVVAKRSGLLLDRSSWTARGELACPIEVRVVHGLGSDLKAKATFRIVGRIVPELALGLRARSVQTAEGARLSRSLVHFVLDRAGHTLEGEATHHDLVSALFDRALRERLGEQLVSGAELRLSDRCLEAWLSRPDADTLEFQIERTARLAHALGERGLRLPPPALAVQVEPIWLEATLGHSRRFDQRKISLEIETNPAIVELFAQKRRHEWWTVFHATLLGTPRIRRLAANRQTLERHQKQLGKQAFGIAQKLAQSVDELELGSSIRVAMCGVVDDVDRLREILQSLVELASAISKVSVGGPYR